MTIYHIENNMYDIKFKEGDSVEEYQILYQIKKLEKLVIRNISGSGIELKKNTKIPTLTQMEIIDYILRNENKDIFQRDLEQVLKLRRATVSGVLQTMEKNNLIIRVQSNEDSRAKKIILNEDTRKIFLKNRAKMEELEKIIVQGISDSELKNFVNTLEKMKKNLVETC